jgi:hypothetical protein
MRHDDVETHTIDAGPEDWQLLLRRILLRFGRSECGPRGE